MRRHLDEQIETRADVDPVAARAIETILGDEQGHHDCSAAEVDRDSVAARTVARVVPISTELVIRLGMRL